MREMNAGEIEGWAWYEDRIQELEAEVKTLKKQVESHRTALSAYACMDQQHWKLAKEELTKEEF